MGSRDDEQQTGGITVTAWQRSLATRFPRRVDSAGTSVGGYDVSASTMAVGLMLATFADYDTGRSAHPAPRPWQLSLGATRGPSAKPSQTLPPTERLGRSVSQVADTPASQSGT